MYLFVFLLQPNPRWRRRWLMLWWSQIQRWTRNRYTATTTDGTSVHDLSRHHKSLCFASYIGSIESTLYYICYQGLSQDPSCLSFGHTVSSKTTLYTGIKFSEEFSIFTFWGLLKNIFLTNQQAGWVLA